MNCKLPNDAPYSLDGLLFNVTIATLRVESQIKLAEVSFLNFLNVSNIVLRYTFPTGKSRFAIYL